MVLRKKPSILVYRPSGSEAYVKYLRNHGYDEVYTANTPEAARRYLPKSEVILGWKFPVELLSTPESESVTWFQSMGAGVDDFLASGEQIPKRIQITRIVDQFGGPIAEYVFAYLLYLCKDVAGLMNAQAAGRWAPFITETLAGKTIGIAGLGSIGLEVVRKARAFDMTVYGLSRTGKNAAAVDSHFMDTAWNSFVEHLDYLILTLPLTATTHHVVNRDVFHAMKPGSCLVNVGRGQLVVEKELLEVLRAGHLSHAVLDVFEAEPLPQGHPFWSMENVHVTPHLSGPSTVQGVGAFFLANLARYEQGEPLLGAVDRTQGY